MIIKNNKMKDIKKDMSLIKIKKRLDDYKNYISNYGFIQEQDIFIKKDIVDFERYLDELEKNEKA
tara:strand:- start:88 stop:282 length:195 start_codon:yes stop_codon:yes gene_type:complete